MSRRAMVVGSEGQDGRLLSHLLLSKGYELTRVGRQSLDITQPPEVKTLVETIQPDEIYYLAAHHHSSEALQSEEDLLAGSFRVNTIGFGNVISAAVSSRSSAGIFYASSAHIFAGNDHRLLDESDDPRPESIYAISKVAAMQLASHYRGECGLRVSCGILFNHESVYRPAQFLSAKVAAAAARIRKTGQGTLVIADLDAVVDWGAAEDYVDAMHRILQLEDGADFVVATGIPHTVRDFVTVAFEHVGLDYQSHVVADASLLQRPTARRIGNPAKLKSATDWQPAISFEEMVVRMVEHEMSIGR